VWSERRGNAAGEARWGGRASSKLLGWGWNVEEKQGSEASVGAAMEVGFLPSAATAVDGMSEGLEIRTGLGSTWVRVTGMRARHGSSRKESYRQVPASTFKRI
jgi:hypothetical protein